MKHISENNIISITASSENLNFPASRMLDEHPKRKYKAATGVSIALFTADVIRGCSDIMLAGTNAAEVSLTAEDPNAILWGGGTTGTQWDSETQWANNILDISGTVIQRSKSYSLFITLSEPVNCPVRLSMVVKGPAGQTLEAGVCTANIAKIYGGYGPQHGLSEDRVDYSIRSENSNGSLFYKKRDIVRRFWISMILAREDAIDISNSFDILGEVPSGWKITELAGNEWVIYGKFDGPPNISHNHQNHSTINFAILEVL